ncbi:uncharacterized protein DUF4224 [Nicoletella semolina]|uniref:Uncharacterized protein DUF4224 n=1 Tax=Nicoletella semolina TaxID=271160 RepID=A0A4R2NAR1_9PAST|nr:DUF4224 domain-containing protein [Nicoletella semolina]MDH2923976.1 hypothetical protein [Nicoletella semolina]TCP18110.1 uncharacterized protein DUF4224 [Nicoletella semolina]
MPQSEFLTLKELVDLTGYTQKKRQIQWLKQRNYIIQDENRYKPLVLYKDVFGQPRHLSSHIQPTKTWHPSVHLTGVTYGKTSKNHQQAST